MLLLYLYFLLCLFFILVILVVWWLICCILLKGRFGVQMWVRLLVDSSEVLISNIAFREGYCVEINSGLNTS